MNRLTFLSVIYMVAAFVVPQVLAVEIGDYLIIDGEVKARNEYRMDYDFDSDAGTDAHFTSLRSRLAFDAKPLDALRVLVQFQDYRYFGEGSPVDTPSVELYQGYMDALFFENRMRFRVGRQEVVFGSERLFSNWDWYKGLVHDGFLGTWTDRKWQLHIFMYKMLEVATQQHDDQLFGTHYTYYPSDASELHVYLNNLKENTKPGDPNRWTFGASYDTTFRGRLTFGIEGIGQFGEASKDVDIMAFAAHMDVGVLFDTYAQHLWLSIDAASGNDDDGDETEEFSQLFGDNYGRLGWMDMVAFQNIIHAGLNYRLYPTRSVYLEAGVHYFQLFSEYGGIYRGNDGLINRIGTGNGEDTALGFEIDTRVGWKLNDFCDFTGGLSYFSPMDYPDDGDGAIWAYVQGRAIF
jgi:hypothetical protein